jgi:hypothetical protein
MGSQSAIRIRIPHPQSASAIRIRNPHAQSASAIRIRNPLPVKSTMPSKSIFTHVHAVKRSGK